LAKYWAEALAAQTEDTELAEKFAALAAILNENETKINAELLEVQGTSVDLEGYYFPNPEKVSKAMRPSVLLNSAIDTF